MADVLALLLAAVLVMVGGVTAVLVARSGRRRNEQIRRDAPRRLRAELRQADDYLQKINDALSEDDLDGLEEKRNEGR